MSMINRKWSDLMWTAQHLGIDTPSTASKQDIINKIATSKSTGPVLQQLPCQLAKDFNSLTTTQQEAVLKSGNYIAEKKFDGCRAKLHFLEDCNRIDTRNQCVDTYCYTEKTDNFPHLIAPTKALIGTVVDGEMVMPCDIIKDGKTQTVDLLTSTASVFNSKPLRARYLQDQYGLMNYILFDILFFKGKDVREYPWDQRRKMLESIKPLLSVTHTARMPLSPVWQNELLACYTKLVAAGGEGIMLKARYAPYSEKEGSRRQRVWYKWKKSFTIEAFVTGYIPGQGKYDGQIGALVISVFDKANATREIASVAPGNDAQRNKLTASGGALADFAYMQVVEIAYQQRTKNGRLRHPVFVNFRPEIHYSTCVDHYFD